MASRQKEKKVTEVYCCFETLCRYCTSSFCSFKPIKFLYKSSLYIFMPILWIWMILFVIMVHYLHVFFYLQILSSLSLFPTFAIFGSYSVDLKKNTLEKYLYFPLVSIIILFKYIKESKIQAAFIIIFLWLRKLGKKERKKEEILFSEVH